MDNPLSVLALSVIMLNAGSASAGSRECIAQQNLVQPASSPPNVSASDHVDRAQAHYEQAIRHYDAHDYVRSLTAFCQAYALRPSSQLLFNVGQVEFLLGRYAAAHRTLTEYLRAGGQSVTRERHTQVLAQLAELARRTGRLRISVDVAGAQIELNGQKVGVSPLVGSVQVDPGVVQVRASQPTRGAVQQDVVVPANTELAVALTFGRAPLAERPTSSFPTLSWVATGALGTAAIGTSIATVLTARHYAAMRAQPAEPGSVERARKALDEQRALVTTLATASDVLVVAALTSATFSIYFTLTSGRDDTAQKVSLKLSHQGILATGQF